jgi:hypothetical protein
VLDASRATTDNIVIGGTTTYDGTPTYLAALDAIFAEWTRTDLDFRGRYSDLLDGTGSPNPLNRNPVTGKLVLLNNQTVRGDMVRDTMIGTAAIDPATGQGAHNWFFVDDADPPPVNYDKRSGRDHETQVKE